MLMSEWESRQTEGNRTVVIVTTHKTGDKEPAALVMESTIADLMQQ